MTSILINFAILKVRQVLKTGSKDPTDIFVDMLAACFAFVFNARFHAKNGEPILPRFWSFCLLIFLPYIFSCGCTHHLFSENFLIHMYTRMYIILIYIYTVHISIYSFHILLLKYKTKGIWAQWSLSNIISVVLVPLKQ